MSDQLMTWSLVGLIVAVALVVFFLKMRRKDMIGAMLQKRQPNSKIVCRADYVEGGERMPVALSLSGETLYYENPDLEASFDLDRLDEIEYGDELSTGKMLNDNQRVLRLRSHGATFEFVMDKADAQKWMTQLPQRQMGGSTARAV